ncbi:hypothetical protein [Nocardiopsis valliformis]|uniref:hypothetical protein n=1 Tax=Nocardiopsis valliformis TaxID=239974 RepID=UPI00034807F3|nr:hypothetical protein [Nocardiopsis valliformis]
MAGRHRAPYDPEARKLEREAMKRERAAAPPEPANRWLIKFSIVGLVLTAAIGVFVWIEHPRGMWAVGLSALIHLINLFKEIRTHLRYRAAPKQEDVPR